MGAAAAPAVAGTAALALPKYWLTTPANRLSTPSKACTQRLARIAMYFPGSAMKSLRNTRTWANLTIAAITPLMTKDNTLRTNPATASIAPSTHDLISL